MINVSGHSQGLSLESLLLQEVGHSRPLLHRDGGKHLPNNRRERAHHTTRQLLHWLALATKKGGVMQNLVSCVEVLSHDGSLVLEHRQLDGVAHNVELLVA